ncbi:hypothetical protein [Treponema denticola]|uniref:hypothetical protein n=1 Tax=Treponema denticola TaxID=158 RepID=UPI0020A5253D|nr:hypothetical protein [Treponema denticola]UTC92368.1 hypothetical protein E4N84_04355 [Treponema denticola]
MSNLKAIDLFEAYAQNKLPMDEGYIVSSFFKEDSAYSVYEIISYSTVKDIYMTGDGLTFQTNGKKLFLLVEPPNFPHKATEPVFRDKNFQVPLRFKESNIYTAKNQSSIIYSKTPQEAISAFTVVKPVGINFAFLFYPLHDTFKLIEHFFEKTLNQEAVIPVDDAKKVAKDFAALCEKVLTWPKE